ncbi:hypothetical protein Aperf_G00000072207 [Anoplocephala perfoliata]
MMKVYQWWWQSSGQLLGQINISPASECGKNTTHSMFEFGQDFSDFLLKNGASFNSTLLQHVLRAQKRHFEETSSPFCAFDLHHQISQGSENIPEFCRLLEVFFTCFAKARSKNETSQNDGISSHIIWPSKPQLSSQPLAVPSTSSSSSRLPSPSVPLPKKQLSKAEKSRTRVDEALGPSEFTTPALNSLIEMTLSNSYQLGNSNEIPKGKSGQKQLAGGVQAASEEMGSSDNGMSSRAPKRRKTRTTFTSFQLAELEVYFSKQKYLTPTDRDQIANELGLSSTQVITWFQNRRAKKKRECAELERDLLASRRNPEKGSTFNFESLQTIQGSIGSQLNSSKADLRIPPPPPPLSPSSSATSPNEVPFSSSLIETKADLSASSQTGPERLCTDPKPIWRPVCLEDIGME